MSDPIGIQLAKSVIAKVLKLYTPKDFLGNPQPEKIWVEDLEQTDDGKTRIVIEAPTEQLDGWTAANARVALDGFIDLQDAADLARLDKYPSPE